MMALRIMYTASRNNRLLPQSDITNGLMFRDTVNSGTPSPTLHKRPLPTVESRDLEPPRTFRGGVRKRQKRVGRGGETS